MSDQLLPNYRKPVGELGKVVIDKMNVGHNPMIRAVVKLLAPRTDDVVLDAGCGGGLAVSLLAEKAGRVFGIDYSDVAVEAARERNKQAMEEGRVDIRRSDVLDMPFDRETFSLVTAFETIYFWDDIEGCFRKIRQAVKPGGRFATVVEAWREGDRIVNEPDRMDILRLNLYSADQLTGYLKQAGFARVEILRDPDEHWLCVVGHKGA